MTHAVGSAQRLSLLLAALCPPAHALSPRVPVKATVSVSKTPWSTADARRGVYLHAETQREVGSCGVQVMELGADGLHGEGPSVKPRAVLSGTLYVEPAYRRQGIAQRLLREAESQARLWGFHELLLPVNPKNANALRLYEKMGYVQLPSSECTGQQVTLRRNLWSPNAHTAHSMFNRHTLVD